MISVDFRENGCTVTETYRDLSGQRMAQDKDIFETLRYKLMTNGFAHGEKLRPEHLRDELGCSASTVREALFRLSTAGLVAFPNAPMPCYTT